MVLLDRILGKRDILVPYFDFSKVLRGELETAILRDICKLRYEVYCLECNFLEARDYKEGMETDEYDKASIHFAAYTLDGSIVGTVRLVQPDDVQTYPWESHCKPFDGFDPPSRDNAAEISRLVVRKTHRRRRGDSMQGISRDFVEQGSTASIQPKASDERDKRGNSPLLLLGLYREMYRHSRANGIRYWYAAMERSLARSLEKMGFKFVPIGPQVDYYGPVTPFMVDLNDLNERLTRDNKFLAAWFNDERIPPWIMIKTMIGSLLTARSQRKRGASKLG